MTDRAGAHDYLCKGWLNPGLLSLGATEYQPITPRGEGFVTAAVVDPFGNVLGVMYNPHYLEILAAGKPG